MSTESELWRGAANAWECDHYGHLNTRFYLGKVEQALPALLAAAGGERRAIATQHLRFHKEVRAGTPLHATGRVLRWKADGGELLVTLVHSHGGEAAATCRIAFGNPARVASEVPDNARERGVSMAVLAGVDANGGRADALGLHRTALTTVLIDQCDDAGVWRLSCAMGLIADASLHLRHGDWREVLARTAPGASGRIGNVLLEIGIVHHRWPRTGDRVEVRSALADCTARITRTAHWLFDPVDGLPWATVSTIGLPLDLDSRRAVALTAQAQDAFRAIAVADA